LRRRQAKEGSVVMSDAKMTENSQGAKEKKREKSVRISVFNARSKGGEKDT